MKTIPFERYSGQTPVPFAVYRAYAPGYAGDTAGLGICCLDGGVAAAPEAPAPMSAEQATALIGAIKSLQGSVGVDPAARPSAPAPTGMMVNYNRPQRPSVTRAIRALQRGSWKGAELERDLSQATSELVPFGIKSGHEEGDDDSPARGFVMPTSVEAYAHVLEQTAIKTQGSTKLGEYAIKALGEGTSALGSVTSAGAVTPIQFLSSEFVLALTSAIVLRQMPEVTVIPVTSNIIELPRESVAAAGAAYAENATLTPNDPTLALQEFAVKKQARLQLFSNELLRDSNPAIDGVVNKMLGRDLALLQDYQYLEGSGSGANVKGLRNYTGLTTSGWVAATNGSTPSADDIIQMIYDIYGANANPSALVMHPRTMKNIVKLKDGSGRYLFTSYASWGGPRIQSIPGTNMTYPSKAVGDLNGMPVYLSTQILTNETQGSSNVATHIIYGDFSKVYILERAAAEIFLSEHYAMNADQTAIRITGRSTVACTQPTALAVATGII